jgi:DNA polymerase elongation subunit (family B)
LKSAVFDLECTALEGVGAGITICACVRPLATQRTRDFRLKYREEWDPKTEGFLQIEETEFLKELVEELGKYDLLIGQNIEAFDLPYLRTRCYRRSLPFDLNPFTYDTMKAFGRVRFRTVLNGFGKPSKSLDMIADFLGVTQEKTKIYPAEHWMSIWGNEQEREEAMQDQLAHCRADVRMTTRIYEVMLPYDQKGLIRRWM